MNAAVATIKTTHSTVGVDWCSMDSSAVFSIRDGEESIWSITVSKCSPKLQKNNDDNKKFYEQFRRCLKLGLHSDSTNRTKVAELFRCQTSISRDDQVSLKEYADQM